MKSSTAMVGWCLSALVVMVAVTLPLAEAAVVKYDWTVRYMFAAPDCVEKQVLAVNDQFPSPTIRAVEGDTVVVRVYNGMPTEGVVFHWHGMHQRGTPFYDGAVYVSQCPINPGETFTYEFKVDRAGTYFYHGHFGMQRSGGLHGSLIVDLPKGKAELFHSDGEHTVVLNDWWHKSTYEQELGLDSIPLRFVGEPQSLLIEGRGRYNCSKLPSTVPPTPGCLTCNASRPGCAPHAIPVTAGKTYRLRVISTASLSALNFILEGHVMTVVMADGRYIKPFKVRNLDVYSGQTYDVLFTADQDASRNYWAGVNVRGRKPATPTGLAVLQYLKTPVEPATPPPVSPLWDDDAASIAQAEQILAKVGHEAAPPKRSDRTVVIMGTQNYIKGHLKWALNNISYVHKSTPVIAALKYKIKGIVDSIPPPDFPSRDYDIHKKQELPAPAQLGSPVYVFRKGSVVDVIVQNANTLTVNHSESHPWHLHGHDFWVLGYGEGMYDPETDFARFNLVDPPVRNTATVFPYGWVALRFVADNPGVWPFHCHIEPHFHMGMGTVFAEGIHNIPRLPKQTLGCGLTKRHL